MAKKNDRERPHQLPEIFEIGPSSLKILQGSACQSRLYPNG